MTLRDIINAILDFDLSIVVGLLIIIVGIIFVLFIFGLYGTLIGWVIDIVKKIMSSETGIFKKILLSLVVFIAICMILFSILVLYAMYRIYFT
jgi:hypothetical protein